MSRNEVANHLNVGKSQIRNYECNNSFPPMEKLIKLAAVYNTTVGEIINNVNDLSIPSQNLSKKVVGNNLRAVRIKKGFTQELIAEKLLVHLDTYKSWERGAVYINLQDLIRLSEIYNESIDYILYFHSIKVD